MGRLTNKQRVFVEEYLVCWNATEAARRAGYRNPEVMGCRLKKVKEVGELIEVRIADKAMSADEVLLRLGEHARGNLGDFIRVNEVTGEAYIDLAAAKAAGKLHLLRSYQGPSDKSAAKIELYDAQAALVHLGRHHSLFVDRTSLNGELNVSVDDARDRLAHLIDRHAAARGAGGSVERPDQPAGGGDSL